MCVLRAREYYATIFRMSKNIVSHTRLENNKGMQLTRARKREMHFTRLYNVFSAREISQYIRSDYIIWKQLIPF